MAARRRTSLGRRTSLASTDTADDAESALRAAWHGSMSGKEPGPVVLQVQSEVQAAGVLFTLAHNQSEGWFIEWKRKL